MRAIRAMLTCGLCALAIALAACDDATGPNGETPGSEAWIAFVTNRDGNDEIYVMDRGGAVRNLTSSGARDRNPVWSPDGSRIAFVSDREGNNEVYVTDLTGNMLNLTSSSGSDSDPVWSPDGLRIAFTSDRDGNREIYVVDAAVELVRRAGPADANTSPASPRFPPSASSRTRASLPSASTSATW